MIAINMPMPGNCGNCPCSNMEFMHCSITERRLEESLYDDCFRERPAWCPLIDLSQYDDDGK